MEDLPVSVLEACFVVWCSVVQCGAVCYSVLQCVAVCCSVLQCVAACCSVLQVAHQKRQTSACLFLFSCRTLFFF